MTLEKEFYKQRTLPGVLIDNVEEPPFPESIGPYKIESLLAKGGMSLLYLALHPTTRQPLVVKVLSPELVTHPEAIERFLKEAHIITLADHPNIIKLYGEGQWEGGLYIAMEMIHGVSLRQFIVQQSLSLKRTIDIVLQVAYALLHLHTHGVIHRDLKPENILISEDGTVKVIDFGIAQLHEDTPSGSGVATHLMGTPNYMSPEQKDNPHNTSLASDIYALGVITYELILGKLSFGMIDLTHLPKGVRKIVGKAIAASPKERYQDSVDFISDLSEYLKSGELEKDRPGSDQYKELLEVIQQASLSLSPRTPPDWGALEMGLARSKSLNQLGFYYDFFKLPNNTHLIILAEATTQGIDAPVLLGMLRGVLRTLIHQNTHTFSPLPFLETLNRLLHDDPARPLFSLSLLLLNPLEDKLDFASCGGGALWHVPSGNPLPRKLESTNPLLGAQTAPELTAASDNWRTGDTLVLCLANPDANEELSSTVQENSLLSSSRAAQNIFRKLTSQNKNPKLTLTLRRIA